MIDTHAHIYSDKFDSDRDRMLERAFEAGLSRIYMPNIDHASIDGMFELEEKYPDRCLPMMGLHPCSVKKGFEKELYICEEWLGKRKFAAVGEMGLDLYWDKTFFEEQQEAFRIQAGWAKEKGLPLVIHARESMEEVIELLEELNDDKLYGVLHCFTGDLDQAKRLIELGFLLGIGGVATFKNGGLDKVLPHLELKNLILETDSPYLAPKPHRGKRNEPSYVPLVASRVSDLMEETLGEVERVTDQNALRMFKMQ